MLCFPIESCHCHSQGRLYRLCFLQGSIVFGPPVNDVLSRFIRYGSLSPFGGPLGTFPGILARYEDGWLVRPHGSACWCLTGFLVSSARWMQILTGFMVAALYPTSVNERLIIWSPIHLYIQQTFIK